LKAVFAWLFIFSSGGKQNGKIINQESCTFRVFYRFWPRIAIPDITDPKPGQQISAYAFACSDCGFCMRLAIRLDSRLYSAGIQKYAVRDAAHVPDSCRYGRRAGCLWLYDRAYV